MAARPQVKDWSTPNLNKPEEYSSEFVQDGRRYAVVVNVSTGQRQLYFVSPGILGINSRSLLQTTNADGSIVPPNEQTQRNLDDFKRTQGGNEALQKALNTTRKQAFFIIEEASTPEEKEELSKEKEYKGFQYQKENPNSSAQVTFINFDTENVSTKSPIPKGDLVTYPNDIKDTKQDRIKITAVSLAQRRILNPIEYKAVGGDVYVSIQGPISDTNLVGWGDSKIGPVESTLFNLGSGLLKDEKGGMDSATAEAKKKVNEFLPSSADVIASQAASGNMDLFTRATQQVFNPNLELIFKEPKLRQFSFTFKMTARDEPEANDIKRIIKYFKYHMAVKGKGGDLFLKAPDVFWIEYQKGTGETHQSLNLIAPGEVKRKACALQTFNVNYTPLGTYMTYDDKECTMIQYDLQFAFSEITPIYQSDYEEAPGETHSIGY